ncbi:MAG TPA: response regulator transcription factor [Burkholderiales bacterium]|nr:response regulator transcription factor [Burkholderiales bacterium]
MKIIVADDHALFRDGLRHILKQLDDGVIIVEAGDHASALALATQHPDADMVLFDLKMPGEEPLMALKAMIAQSSTTPVVVLSASEDISQVREALDAGAMGFIPKHESARVMLSAIQLVLSGGIYVPPMLMKSDSPAVGSPLTPRQLNVLKCLVQGKSNKEIGRELGLSESTVKSHLAAIFRCLNASNRTEAVHIAEQRGLLRED